MRAAAGRSRRISSIVVAAVVVVATSGCTTREVQLWFAVYQHTDISRDDARTISQLANGSRLGGGCDPNYVGACVPDNQTSVHCAGTAGYDLSVKGPLLVSGWDSFELDPDGDRVACADPVGRLETIGQELDGIHVRGWTFDPESDAALRVLVSDNGDITQLDASIDLGPLLTWLPGNDVQSELPSVSTAHWFDVRLPAEVGETHAVCVAALNVGAGINTTLGCSTITLRPTGDYLDGAVSAHGLIEEADFVLGGVRVRGYFHGTGPSLQFRIGQQADVAEAAPLVTASVPRPDVQAVDPSAPAVTGFDITLERVVKFTLTTQVCLKVTADGVAGTSLMCRPIGT